jgi:ankyrin repeat protein
MPSISVKALHNACIRGDVAAVSRLLPARGTPLNLSGLRFQSSPHKTTPLMNASCGGHMDIVRLILDRARNTAVDHANQIGSTALLVAAQYHHADIVRLLADRGASVNHAGPEGRTPLRVAVGQNHDCDAPPRDPDPDGLRLLNTVMALLQLDAGTLPSPPPT